MKHLYIYPYKIGSRSASALSRALGVPQIKHERSAFIGGPHKTVINWGASGLSNQVLKSKVLNNLQAVRRAGNKLFFFKDMAALPEADRPRLVPWTVDFKEAQKWQAEGSVVFARTILNGHSGSGIIVCEAADRIPETAPLFTKYIMKESEWRLHFMKGVGNFYTQRKIKDPDVEQPKTWKIRSHDNGFIFQHNNLEVPADVVAQATLAFAASGLDFGGVDVIHTKKGRAYVLEINTAVGLEGLTIEMYKTAFERLLHKNKNI